MTAHLVELALAVGCWVALRRQRRQEATGAPLTAEEVAVGHPMLDPAWTPERGYSHADRLLAILREAETSRG